MPAGLKKRHPKSLVTSFTIYNCFLVSIWTCMSTSIIFVILKQNKLDFIHFYSCSILYHVSFTFSMCYFLRATRFIIAVAHYMWTYFEYLSILSNSESGIFFSFLLFFRKKTKQVDLPPQETHKLKVKIFWNVKSARTLNKLTTVNFYELCNQDWPHSIISPPLSRRENTIMIFLPGRQLLNHPMNRYYFTQKTISYCGWYHFIFPSFCQPLVKLRLIPSFSYLQ